LFCTGFSDESDNSVSISIVFILSSTALIAAAIILFYTGFSDVLSNTLSIEIFVPVPFHV
jgi:hypothetical protein